MLADVTRETAPMKLAFVHVRDGKRTVNLAVVLLIGVLSAAIGTGLSFLLAALLPASTATTTFTNLLPLLFPIVVVMPLLIRGLSATKNDSANLND